MLVAVDCNRGVFKWNATSSEWASTTWSDFPGKAHDVETNLATGYTDDIYAIIANATTGVRFLLASDSGGALGSWQRLGRIDDPRTLTGHTTGMWAGDREGHVYRFTGGVSTAATTIYTFANTVGDIAVYNASLIFALVQNSSSEYNLYKVSNSSGSFAATKIALPTATPSGTGTVSIDTVGVDPADADILYIAGSSAYPQIYRSIDGGTSWSHGWDTHSSSPNHYPGDYPTYVKFHNNYVIISRCAMAKGGTSWSLAPNLNSTIGSGSSAVTVLTHPNSGALEFDKVATSMLYLSTDWGVGNMTLASGSWTAGQEMGNNKGITGVILNDMSFYSYNATSKELWIAAKSGAGRTRHFNPMIPSSTSSPSDWYFPIFPQDSGLPVTAVEASPDSPAWVLVGNNGGDIYKTSNGNSSSINWSIAVRARYYPGIAGSAVPTGISTTDIATSPATSNGSRRAYASFANSETNDIGGVLYTDDNGTSWTEDTGISGSTVNALWIDANRVLAGLGKESNTHRGLKGRDSVHGAAASAVWSALATSTNLDNEIVSGIDGADFAGNVTIYVVSQATDTTTGGVYKATANATTCTGYACLSWSSLTSALNSTVGLNSTSFTAVAVNPDNTKRVYVSVGNYIYNSTDGGAHWSVFGSSGTDSHEDVRVLKYDDILAGTANGLYAYEDNSTQVDFAGNSTVASEYQYLFGAGVDLSGLENEGNFTGGMPDNATLSAQLDSTEPDTVLAGVNALPGGADINATLTRKISRSGAAVNSYLIISANATISTPVNFSDLTLAKVATDTVHSIRPTANPTDAANATPDIFWYLRNSGGVVTSGQVNGSVNVVIAVKDNGAYDLNSTVGAVADPAFVATSASTASSSSSSGCLFDPQAGFSPWTLLMLLIPLLAVAARRN